NVGGSYEENVAYRYDWQNAQTTELFVEGELTFAMCAGNDGSVGGSYNRKAAIFFPEENQWFELPIPNIKEIDYSGVSAMSANGDTLTGFWQTAGWNMVPIKWIRTASKQYQLDTMDYIAGNNSHYPTGNYFIRTDGMSADGKVTTGMLSVDGTEWLPVVWNPTYTLLFKDSANLRYADAEVLPSANGRYVTGIMHSLIDPQNPANMLRKPYRYDLQENKMDICTSMEDVTCSDNEGNTLGFITVGGAPSDRIAHIWNPSTGLDMLLSDYLVDMYQLTAFRDELKRTGVPMGITGDGKTMCAFGQTADGNLVSWVVRLGAKKQCLRPQNFVVKAVHNETIEMKWDAPSGEEANIAGYNVYWETVADAILLNDGMGLITTTNYTWDNLPKNASGQIPPAEYKLSVQAIYKNECISGKASASASIYVAGDCNAPTNLKAEMDKDAASSVKLRWEIPTFDLRWDNGTNNHWGMANNAQPFFFGVRYTAEDLKDLVGSKITHLTFYANASADFIINIWEDYTRFQSDSIKINDSVSIDGYRDSVKVVLRQVVDNVRVLDFNRIPLETSFVIEANKDYIFGGSVQGYGDKEAPVGRDQAPTQKPGQSDLFSHWKDATTEEPLNWHSLYPFGGDFLRFNWNLALTLETSRPNVLTPVVPGKPNPWDATLGSYTIYRDGDSIGKATETQFYDRTFKDQIAKAYTYSVKANYLYDCVSAASENLVFNRTIAIEKEGDLSGYIYPNPVCNGILNINLNYSDLWIVDAQGRVVLHSATPTTTLDVSKFNSGMYVVKARVDGKIKTHKLIVK
ncbi:MAG: T9SS type A sorting domain-containing protein, partial [Bacteroidales bacterium]